MLLNKRTPSSRTGPQSNRITERGRYLYYEASRKRRGDSAILNTRYQRTNGKSQCLEFFYHMYGKSMGNLILYFENKNGLKKEVWRKTGNQGNKWRQALVNIKGVSGGYYKVCIFIIIIILYHPIYIYVQSADSTVSLFMSSSVQNRRFRLNLRYETPKLVTKQFNIIYVR